MLYMIWYQLSLPLNIYSECTCVSLQFIWTATDPQLCSQSMILYTPHLCTWMLLCLAPSGMHLHFFPGVQVERFLFCIYSRVEVLGYMVFARLFLKAVLCLFLLKALVKRSHRTTSSPTLGIGRLQKFCQLNSVTVSKINYIWT